MFRILLLFLIIAVPAHAIQIQDLMPEETYLEGPMPPSDFLGFEPGEWHLRPDQLTSYFRALAEASSRVSLEVVGHTHERREQLLVAISHPDNIARLDELRQGHLDYAHGRSDDPGPLIVWLGYSIHGDEASGSNAAPLVGYHLAAADSIGDWLKDTIVLIDPSLNPDGMGRFAQWVNGHKSKTPVTDPNDREHQEAWPTGRSNHYWFDLNRDWLLLTHPESRNRVAVFQNWRPHVFGDFHEMGRNSTYFFQPGVPERQNPLTPPENVAITAEIARFHARALDALGQLYFSEEVFDDYYYGKGSTYPDIQGSIGILFEQATAAGHRIETINGPGSLELGIRNQFTTSLSTLQGARSQADRIKRYQRDFMELARDRADAAEGNGVVFGDAADPYRAFAMADRLRRHGIEVHTLGRVLETDEARYEPGAAYVVPFDQPQYPLVEALFETRTDFQDTTFYDVSSWNFPLSFNLAFERVRNPGDLQGAPFEGQKPTATAPGEGYAYAIDWSHYLAPRALARLLQAGLKVRAATKPFTGVTADGNRAFGLGTLVVPGSKAQPNDRLDGVLQAITAEDGVPVTTLRTGLTPEGIDLGSSSLEVLEPVNPLLVVGPGVRYTSAGEVWHLLDTRIGLPPVMVSMARLAEIDLNEYTHLLLVDGNYDSLPETWIPQLRGWLRTGGVLVASQDAAAWVTRKGLHLAEPPAEATDPQPPEEDKEPPEPRPYGEHSSDYSKSLIGGAIVAAEVDATHPLAYGYRGGMLPVFRNSTVFLERSDNPYETPLRYREEPLLSGYLGEERTGQLAGSASVIANRVGSGAVIRFADNPNFRGIWFGTNKLFLNALFFGQILDYTPLPDFETRL